MIECVTEATPASDWYDEACRRARASRRRRQPRASTELPEFAPPVALSDGPLGRCRRRTGRSAGRPRSGRGRWRNSPPRARRRPTGPGRAGGDERGAVGRAPGGAAPGERVGGAGTRSSRCRSAPRPPRRCWTRSLTLVHRLPGTLAALEAGALHPGHLWPMLEKVAPIEDATVRAEVEAELLRWAAGRVTTPAQLGAKARARCSRATPGRGPRAGEGDPRSAASTCVRTPPTAWPR